MTLAPDRPGPGWPGRAGAASLLAAVLALAGCASRPPVGTAVDGATVQQFSGRLVVQVQGQADRSFSAGFELTGNAQAGALQLTTPLGTTAAMARWQPGRAVLQSGRDEQTFDSAQALITQALGEPLPLAALFDWLRGRPWPDAAHRLRDDAEPGFEQLGWQVSLLRWRDGWLEARQPGPPPVTVRVRLDSGG